MLSTKNTRSQALPLYFSKSQWFEAKYPDAKKHLIYPPSTIPASQIILGNGVAAPAGSWGKVIDAQLGTDMLGGSGLDKTVADFDINYDEDDEKIVTIAGPQQGFGSTVTGKAYLEIVVNGNTLFSEPFYMCSNLKYKLTWKNSCDKNNAYYSDGFTNAIYFKNLSWNIPKIEKSRESEADLYGQEKTTKLTQKKIYSFSVYVPDYLIDAYNALEHHDEVIIENIDTGEKEYLSNITVDISSDEEEAYHKITVRYEIIKDEGAYGITFEEPYTVGCCEPIAAEDVECEAGPGQGGADCTGFDVNVVVSGLVLTYTLSNEPTSGSLNQTWFKNGVPIGTGSSVTMGAFGEYRVQVSKSNCVANDSHTYLDPCAGWTVKPSANGGIITAMTSGNTSGVTYEVYDDSSTLLSSALPYTVAADGIYTLKASMGDCEKDFSLNIATNSGDHTAAINKSGMELTGVSTGCMGTLTHRWEFDEGNGLSVMGSNISVTATKNGLYVYYAICDGAEVSAQRVVVDVCTPIQICNPEDFKDLVTVNVTGQLDVC